MSKPWNAVLIPVSGPLRRITLKGLDDMQGAVGGYFQMLSMAEDAVVYINEDGKGLGLPRNERATAFVNRYFPLAPDDYIVGPMVVSGPADKHGNETSIRDSWINRLPEAPTKE